MIYPVNWIPSYHARIPPMTDKENEAPPCVSEACKADRYEKQLEEGVRAIEESTSLIQTALQKLHQAARELGEHGEVPLQDLERG